MSHICTCIHSISQINSNAYCYWYLSCFRIFGFENVFAFVVNILMSTRQKCPRKWPELSQSDHTNLCRPHVYRTPDGRYYAIFIVYYCNDLNVGLSLLLNHHNRMGDFFAFCQYVLSRSLRCLSAEILYFRYSNNDSVLTIVDLQTKYVRNNTGLVDLWILVYQSYKLIITSYIVLTRLWYRSILHPRKWIVKVKFNETSLSFKKYTERRFLIVKTNKLVSFGDTRWRRKGE